MAERPGTTKARISANSKPVNHRFIFVSSSGAIVTQPSGARVETVEHEVDDHTCHRDIKPDGKGPFCQPHVRPNVVVSDPGRR